MAPEPGELQLLPVQGLPEIAAGERLGELIAPRCELRDEDAVVLSQKAVSKAEGRIRHLSGVTVGDEALTLAAELDKEPALVQLILEESVRIVRAERDVLICETRHGWVCANAGIDASNVPGADAVTLLPLDPDASARRIRAEIRAVSGVAVAVVIADSFGRAWRLGQVDVAIGCAGLAPLEDWRGRIDRDGRQLAASAIAVADELAAAADLVRDKLSGTPAVLARGLRRNLTADDGPGAAALRRAAQDDLFR
jgi:coenzyme F420-0:L-glutamate ligase / coenzyme F420-1:gamma-L-glutamate ligase